MRFLSKVLGFYELIAQPKSEWIHMRSEDLKRLEKLGLPVKDGKVEVEVSSEETDNGFRTVFFSAKSLDLEVYLDVRYERGGAYQFANKSKDKLHIPIED